MKKKESSKKFDIPENPLEDSIEINDNFRIIGVCDSQKIDKMSPAFLNRFDLIVLEDQLEEINKGDEKEFKLLIKTLFEKEEEKTQTDRIIETELDEFFDNDEEEEEEEKKKR